MKTAKPLSGIKVLDLGRMFAAPWSGQMLADLGADVVKIESLGGDVMRSYGPPFLKDEDGELLRESAYSLSVNRGKKSVAVDLSKPEGCDLVKRLALASDVIIENFKVGDLARKGLDYASLKPLKPELIYCSLTAFGQTGPYAHLPGVDTAFQAMSGLMSVTGEPDGEPQKIGFVVTDFIAGLYGVIAILAALRHSEVAHGAGQHIDLALLDSAISAVSHRAMEYFITGQLPARLGNGSPGNIPARTFQCKEGIISVQAGADAQFKKLCKVLGREDLLEGARFSSRAARIANEAELVAILASIFQTRTATEWFGLLGENKIYCGPVYTLADTFDDPQVKHRGMRQMVPHPQAGVVAMLANPIHFSETPLESGHAPPGVGVHTAEVLKDMLGFSAAEIDAYEEAGIIETGRVAR